MHKRIRNQVTFVIIIFSVLTLNSCSVVSDALHYVQDYKTVRAIGEPNTEADSNSQNEYVYQTLTPEEKLAYDQMYECMDQFKEKVPLTTKDENVMKKSFNSIFADHGEKFYWVHGFSFQSYKSQKDGYVSGVTFTPNYTMTLEEKNETDKAILEVYKEWIKDLPENSDDYTKSKYVYDKLIEEVDYVSGAPDNQNIKSVFLNKATVCKGYATAVSYFFDKLGIPCTIITGEGRDESHAWNLIELDGEYYYYDVTWGNSAYRSSGIKEKRTNYSYLNVTGQEIFKTHTADEIFPLPECTSTENNYFNKEGLLFDEDNYWELGGKLYSFYISGIPSVSLRFENETLYDKAFNHLISERNFDDYLPGIQKLMYLEDKEVNTLTLIF